MRLGDLRQTPVHTKLQSVILPSLASQSLSSYAITTTRQRLNRGDWSGLFISEEVSAICFCPLGAQGRLWKRSNASPRSKKNKYDLPFLVGRSCLTDRPSVTVGLKEHERYLQVSMEKSHPKSIVFKSWGRLDAVLEIEDGTWKISVNWRLAMAGQYTTSPPQKESVLVALSVCRPMHILDVSTSLLKASGSVPFPASCSWRTPPLAFQLDLARTS
jgi:hypothetical protein